MSANKILCKFVRNYCTKRSKSKCVELMKDELKKKQEERKSASTSIVKKSPKEQESECIERAVLETFQQRSIRVTIIGADTKLGEMTSLMLKQNPLISRIFLYGNNNKTINRITNDLNHIDTRAYVSGHKNDLPAAIRGADIVLLFGTDYEDTGSSIEDKLRREGDLIIERATICSYYAPRSLLIVCVDPIAVTLPLVKAVYKAGQWYHPGKVIGSVALSQMRANTLVALYQGLDPSYVDVPLIGGPDLNTIVPLFTRAKPVGLTIDESMSMLKKFRSLPYDSDLNECENLSTKLCTCPLSESFAINRTITNIGLGICGDTNCCVNAFVRSNSMRALSHFTSTVRFDINGLNHNYCLPNLYKRELDLLFMSVYELKRCERIANDYFLKNVEKKEELVNVVKS